MALHELTIHESLAELRAGNISSVELTDAYLERIAQVDPQVQAYLTVTADRARADAHRADEARARGEEAPLLGVPIALKDIFCTTGIETTCASRILKGFVPPYDATVVAKLAEAGAVLLGKTNMDEFAMGSSTENSAFMATHNPWDLDRVPGGSSGGSAAAVAAGLAAAALGTDTGGSIRQPAALCGVVGIKPTYGRVSRYGVIAFASSLDQVGPFARNVADCALMLRTISGQDPFDSTSLPEPVPDYAARLDGDLHGMRIGIPDEYFVAGMEPGVETAVRRAIDTLVELGAEVGAVSLPHSQYALATYYLIAPAEASANLARYDSVKYGYRAPHVKSVEDSYMRSRGEGFGTEVKRRIRLGTYALSSGYYDAYYLKAQKVRTLIKADFDAAFQRFDALVAPTSPSVAFPLGARTQDPLTMYLSDVCTLPPSLAGLPALSMPCGLSDGLPVGLQIIGPALGEETILRVAAAYERASDWRPTIPAIG
ncbi:MAG: aspartyl-tRNA(Asn)/glutamyl-tRNA(Gln) amidotransferase subunit [Chloroflexota bacterium]|jgi:aspartyl-tRNA(Asn)/glutamyl-tRNA(Gln) amidotransferase subunit A|nr:aspartyl-tRNA(Asn)/glutamyl-tRNA(Gln) amidotransferase subunit [Chloroflexota bacterium]